MKRIDLACLAAWLAAVSLVGCGDTSTPPAAAHSMRSPDPGRSTEATLAEPVDQIQQLALLPPLNPSVARYAVVFADWPNTTYIVSKGRMPPEQAANLTHNRPIEGAACWWYCGPPLQSCPSPTAQVTVGVLSDAAGTWVCRALTVDDARYYGSWTDHRYVGVTVTPL